MTIKQWVRYTSGYTFAALVILFYIFFFIAADRSLIQSR